jgi:Ca-activated chloride channel family protein
MAELELDRVNVVRLCRARVFLVCAVIVAYAGERPQAQPADQSGERFTLDTTLVLIPVTVTDSMNRFVLGLHKGDFRLYENGAEQTITNFSGEDAPLSVGLVFDTSGSMLDKLRTSRRAAIQFLRTMNAQDEAFLVEFGDQASLAVRFTSQLDEIQTKLTAAEPGGLTAMLDGAQLALHEMQKAKNPRKAMVIISDGGDNNSRYTAKEIESLVREADVQVYAMGVFQPSIFTGLKDDVNGARLLSQLAEQTGGRAFSASDANDLPSVAARIAIELRNQYVLAYRSTNRNNDGKYRKVEVKIGAQPGIPNLKVHWRLGYYAPSQ